MSGSALDAVPYLKQSLSRRAAGPITDTGNVAPPVFGIFSPGVLIAYLIDEGAFFTYVQETHLRAAGMTADELHPRAVGNLARVTEGHVTVEQHGPIWAFLFDGSLDASLVFLDDMWDRGLREYHGVSQSSRSLPGTFCVSVGSHPRREWRH